MHLASSISAHSIPRSYDSDGLSNCRIVERLAGRACFRSLGFRAALRARISHIWRGSSRAPSPPPLPQDSLQPCYGARVTLLDVIAAGASMDDAMRRVTRLIHRFPQNARTHRASVVALWMRLVTSRALGKTSARYLRAAECFSVIDREMLRLYTIARMNDVLRN
jgi:hypothetical protein